MNVQETKEQLIAELIRLAFAEDIGDGDHTFRLRKWVRAS
jgi:nicotinate-nucleotide pyrophosphorylase (carboxylating)